MAFLVPNDILDSVYQLETTDPVQGGPGGVSNQPNQQLLNRTEWLRARIAAAGIDGTGTQYSGDMDALMVPGYYWIRAGATNKPVVDSGACLVVGHPAAFEVGDVPAYAQLFIPIGTNNVWVRFCVNGISVSSWERMIGQSEYDSVIDSFIGSVSAFAMATPPTGWLECDGAAVSRTTYANLFAKIGIVYGSGDGSTTFNLPDMRGEFPRGWDNGKGVDPGRAIGSGQGEDIISHLHSETRRTESGLGYAAGTDHALLTLATTNTGSTGGTETRPRNVAMMYCIKY